MSLDLHELTADWTCEPGEISARIVIGRDGGEMLQLRVDLGVMQMCPDGRPDGTRYRGLPTVLEYIEHEARLGGGLATEDGRELERELYQINYRRLALSRLVEECLIQKDAENARRHLERALRDIDGCLERLDLARKHCGRCGGSALRPTLTFHRGRLRVQRAILEDDYDGAVDEALRGQQDLDDLLAEVGFSEEQRQEDPGVIFLHNLAQRLRREYGIAQTLNEQLQAAVEAEDFALAAQLREQLRSREEGRNKK